jgi:3-methyl-2-oxobutanoate hydroxymethyltransferase
MSKKWTTSCIRASKGRQKLICLTAYDYTSARLLDEAGVNLILVGDSLAGTVLGYKNTLPVTMEEMLHHTAAAARGVQSALLVADMPFMSFQISIEQAITNGGRFLKEASADAVKIEGGELRSDTIKALVENGIPVLGHIGLTPQSINQLGGYKVQGKKPPEAKQLIKDAIALEKAGVFAIVLECIPPRLAAEITKTVKVPTIGIGAGRHCDGQILVMHDMLGMCQDLSPKFVKRYAELGNEIKEAVKEYAKDVQSGKFPADQHTY